MAKRGVSEVVSYVMLILIAIAIAGLVFIFMKGFVPKAKAECKDGIEVILTEATCRPDPLDATKDELIIQLENRGLFKVHEAFIRLGELSAETKKSFNSQGQPTSEPIKLWAQGGASPDEGLNPQAITPRFEFTLPPEFTSSTQRKYVLEVQPAYYDDEKKRTRSLCPAISETVTCT